SPEHLTAMLSLGISSLLIVPLIARDRVLGTLTLAAAESGVHYNKDDQDFAIELAMRAAVAIDNARLYREAQEAIEKKDQALALLHAVLQQMPAGVVIAEAPSGKVLLRNQFAMDFWCGKSPVSEHLDMSGGYFTALHPDGSIFKDEDWPLSRALRTGASRVGEEFE